MRIALLHPGALGDLILALPLMQMLAEEAPGGRLDLVASASRAEFLAGRSIVAAGRSIESPSLARLFADGPPDGAGDLAGFDRVIVGFNDERFPANLAAVLPGARVDRLDVQPASIERAGPHASLFLCRQLFPAAEAPLPRILPTQADLAHAAASLSVPHSAFRIPHSPAPLVLVHPGSGSRAKCWPAECFCRVADDLVAAGCRVLFVLGEAEMERMAPADRQAISKSAGGCRLVSDLSLGQLAGLIAQAAVYLGNDAGPTHLAAAIGTPTIALFGPTDPHVWAPRGRQVTVVRGRPSVGPDWDLAPPEVAAAVLTAARSEADCGGQQSIAARILPPPLGEGWGEGPA